MNADNQTKENHSARSNFVRELVQRSATTASSHLIFSEKLPNKIVQFWDNFNRLPSDVEECIETWKKVEKQGIERLIFDAQRARDFIHRHLSRRHKRAFDKCYHPAMKSDYFRLCYIFVEGGCYIDTDDVYNGLPIQHIFNDGRLKIQPLCYDTATNMMVPPQIFTKPEANSNSWVFYFNNNPLAAKMGHPLIGYALSQATLSLEKIATNEFPEIQSTTGPGNLTKSIFDAATENPEVEQSLYVLSNWEDIVTSRWNLNYRDDARNWRLSNCRAYLEE